MRSPFRATFRIVGMTLMAISITMVPAFVVSMICREWKTGLMFILLALAVLIRLDAGLENAFIYFQF